MELIIDIVFFGDDWASEVNMQRCDMKMQRRTVAWCRNSSLMLVPEIFRNATGALSQLQWNWKLV